jgi:hypothetical protein
MKALKNDKTNSACREETNNSRTNDLCFWILFDFVSQAIDWRIFCF